MNKEQLSLYVSPKMKVVEIKTSQILCASPEGFGAGGDYPLNFWN